MKAILTLATLLLLLCGGTALAQGTAADLERQAIERFEEGDLARASLLYRQAAHASEEIDEKARLLIYAAWAKHLGEDEGAALATLTEALELAPDVPFRGEVFDEGFRNLFYEAQKEALARRAGEAAEEVHQAERRIAEGAYAEARRHLERALELQRDYPRALFHLALVDLREGLQEEATAGFEKVVALDRGGAAGGTGGLIAPALINLGLLYDRRGLYEEAETLLVQAVEIDPDQSLGWTNLGISRRNLGRHAEAAQAFRRAHELEPENPDVINNLALAYLDSRDWVPAVGLLVEATRRFEDHPKLWLNLGRAQRGMGNSEGAVASFRKVMALDPDNRDGLAVEAAARLARHYRTSEDPARSLAEAQRVVAWRPERAEGWIYQGLAQQALGELGAARRSLEEAVRLDPTSAETHNNLGTVHLALRDFDRAEASFRRALEIRPSFASARKNLETLARHRAANPGATAEAPTVVVSQAPPPPRPVSPPRETPPPQETPPPKASPPPAPASREHGLTFAKIDYAAMGLRGTLVEAVAPESPAERAGIRPEDLIVRVDDQDVESGEKLDRYLREQTDRSSFNLVILRDNLPRQLILRLR